MQKTAIGIRPARWRRRFIDQILLVMKLTAILLTTFFLSVSAKVVSQNVTFSGERVPLKTVLSAVEKQTGYAILYTSSALETSSPVTVSAADVPLEDFLAELFKPLPLTYNVSGKNILVFRKPATEDLILGNTPGPIRGRVLDEEGRPLAGASVSIRNAKRTSITDVTGEFDLDVKEGDVIVVTYVGFEPKEIRMTASLIASGNTYITLSRVSAALNEVVINKGYYTEKQRLSTGSVVKVTSKEIENQPVTSPLLALQGRVPGLEVRPANGAPGIAPAIRIRGNNSLRFDGGYPLFVVDGMVVDSRPLRSQSALYNDGIDPLAGIDPENIESIEVLKDADATSIYGSRGANGVILIKTKARKSNAPIDVTANAYYGIAQMPKFMKLLNTQQYLEMRKEAFKDTGLQPGFFDFDLTLYDSTRNTDWQRELLGGSAKTTDISIALSGGSERTSFRVTSGYHKETTIVSDDFGYTSADVGINLSHRSSDQRFHISMVANYSINKNNILNVPGFFASALDMSPNTPDLYNADGSLNWGPVVFPGTTLKMYSIPNPMAELYKTNATNIGTLMTNGTLSYWVTKGLLLKTSLGYTDVNGDELIKSPILARDPGNTALAAEAAAHFGTNKRRSWIVEPQASYDFKISDHQFNFLIGSTFQESRYQWRAVTGSGYTSDVLLNSLRGAASYSYQADDLTEYRYTAAFARLGYNWKEKYLVNLTGRRDGSSRFGPGKQFGNFGAVGAAWIFSSEEFMKGISNILSFGKLRGSYGSTGNDQISDYKFYNLYEIGGTKYQHTTALVPKGLFNSDFNWEVTRKAELALELSFLKDRISLLTSWFRNRSSNQVIEYQLPSITGFSSISKNFDATVENTGWEFVISSQHINNANFTWTTSVNFTIPRNRLVAFANLEESPYLYTYKVGESLSASGQYIWKGVDPQTGLHVIEDVNGDGFIDYKDMIVGNSMDPEYYGGVSNTIRYKGLEMVFQLYFSKGMGHGHYDSYPGSVRANQPIGVMDRWRKAGDISPVAKFSNDYMTSNPFTSVLLASNYNYTDASFVKLKTLSLSYAFPGSFLTKYGIKEARFFLQGQNLFTITGYVGLDPETGGRTLPQLRSITGGISLKF